LGGLGEPDNPESLVKLGSQTEPSYWTQTV